MNYKSNEASGSLASINISNLNSEYSNYGTNVQFDVSSSNYALGLSNIAIGGSELYLSGAIYGRNKNVINLKSFHSNGGKMSTFMGRDYISSFPNKLHPQTDPLLASRMRLGRVLKGGGVALNYIGVVFNVGTALGYGWGGSAPTNTQRVRAGADAIVGIVTPWFGPVGWIAGGVYFGLRGIQDLVEGGGNGGGMPDNWEYLQQFDNLSPEKYKLHLPEIQLPKMNF